MITPLDILSIETWTLLISIIVLIRLYIHRKWQVLSNLNIPHDPPSILGLGNLGELFKNPDKIFLEDLNRKKKFGNVYGSYNWMTPRIVISDPDILKQIYIKEAGTFRDRQREFAKINGKEMNTALTSASGDQWKRIRNTITPTFSTSKIKDMFTIVDEYSDKIIENLHEIIKTDNGRFEAKKQFGNFSMDVICSAAFGVNLHSQDSDNELVQRTRKLTDANFFGFFTFLFLIFPWTEKIAEKLNYSLFDKDTMSYYRRLIDRAIKGKKESGDKARMDILQGMLTNEIKEDDAMSGTVKGLTRTEIVGNSMLMVLAGYETTANTILFLAYCLATDDGVQEKLREEVKSAVEEHSGLTYEAVNSMKYLDMCMKESQRLYGVVPRNSRYTDVEITVKGITIPAGTHVDVPVYGLHHDEEYWEDPWKFIPDRFEDMSKIDPMVFQPFGAGPRNCIGMRLAILEIKMAVAKIVQNFHLELCDDTPKPPLELTLRGSFQPKKDVFLKVSERN